MTAAEPETAPEVTVTERAAALVADLTARRAERKDELDLPRTMTQREANAYVTETVTLDRWIASLRALTGSLADVPSTDAEEAWLVQLHAWRRALCDRLDAIKSPIRDRDLKQLADALMFSIRLIDFGFGACTIGPVVSLASLPLGELMAEAGYPTDGPALQGPHGWLGGLREVEQRIKASKAKGAAARAALDAALLA